MRILYVTYCSMEDTTSGSGVRPVAMYHAFLERGHDVYLLSDFCGRGQGKQRQEAVKKAIGWMEQNHPDLCYIESPTYPILNHCDYALIRLLHRKKIPTAYFYRDFYRKFPQLFPRRKGFVNGLKELYLDFLQWRTDRILRLVDVVYFPSEQWSSLFSYRRMKALPPAGELLAVSPPQNYRTCIYVGGISDNYGLPLLIQTFSILNHDSTQYHLILVCRENEYREEQKKIGEHPWLEVYHASGKALELLYAQANVGLLTLQPNSYNNFAVGTKLFQYISYGLPVVSTDVPAMKSLIETNHFGLTAPNEPAAFAAAIRQMLDQPDILKCYQETAVSNLQNSNLWVHRVDEVISDLMQATSE